MDTINRVKYREIGRRMRALPQEQSSTSYEWEELVEKLCASDDADLHEIGLKELNDLLHKHPLNGGR